MSTPPPPNELLSFLGRSLLLTPAQVESLERDIGRFGTGEQLAAELVGRGWLTAFQEKTLLEGQGEKLVVGPFRLLEVVGEGGMGVVYKARHPRLDRFVALKLIRPQVLAAKPEIITRFHREARAIGQLSHPNIVTVFDAGEVDNTHYLAMEYVEGITLDKMVRLNGPLAIRQACDYMRQAALGLQHAHEQGLVHRDIKPSNLLIAQRPAGGSGRSSVAMKRPALITPRDKQLAGLPGASGKGPHSWGLLKILDMGLARLQESLEEAAALETPLTKAGSLLGTPDFISPEQARDARTVDVRSDLYSLGCTFYYLLTSRPPFPGGTEVQKLLRHQTEMPAPMEETRPHLPSAVVRIVERLIQKHPRDRYQTPQEVADDLSTYLDTPSESRATPTDLQAGRFQPPHTAETPASSPVGDVPGAGGAGDVPGAGGTGTVATGSSPETPSAFETMMVDVVAPPADTSNRLVTQAHTGVVAAVSVSPDGRMVATGGLDGRVRLWDCSGRVLKEIASLPRPGTEVQAVTFAPDEPFVVIAGVRMGNAYVWRWDWAEGRLFDWGGFVTTAGHGVGAAAFAPDGKAYAVAVGSFVVHWKVAARVPSSRSFIKGHTRPVLAVEFSPDRRLLATAGEGRSVRLWGFGWLGPSLRSRVEGHGDRVMSVAFSPDGKTLAGASLDQTVMLWDTANPSQEPRVLYGHTNGVRLVRFLPDGQRLVSVADAGQVYYWDLATGVRLHELQVAQGIASSIALTVDARRLVVGTSDGKLALFELEPAAAAGATRTG